MAGAPGQRVGYIRVSSFDQNPDRQRDQLDQAGVHRLFVEKASGKTLQRPELDALLAFVREGDTVVVASMDRLARNLDDLRRLVQQFTAREIRVEFLKEHLTFTGDDSPMAQPLLSVNQLGPADMQNRQHTTSWRPAPMLSVRLQEELRQAIAGPAPDHSKRWTARAVAAWISQKLDRPVRVQRGWDYLQRLKQSQQLPRPHHVLADLLLQIAFKKNVRPPARSRWPRLFPHAKVEV
jgi:hypothetical protein